MTAPLDHVAEVKGPTGQQQIGNSGFHRQASFDGCVTRCTLICIFTGGGVSFLQVYMTAPLDCGRNARSMEHARSSGREAASRNVLHRQAYADMERGWTKSALAADAVSKWNSLYFLSV